MNLSDYPRPPQDNGRGVHWSPSTSVWGRQEFETKWLPFLKEAKIKWVKMMDDGGGSSFELAKWLVANDIMPIVRMYIHPNYPGYIGGQHVEYANRLAEIGVFYVEFGNEPDLALEWRDKKRPENWLEIVVDRYIDAWDKVQKFGTIPLFDAFGPGGKGNPFAIIKDRGRDDVLWKMGIAVHNYCLGRPLEYPNDGIADFGTPYTPEQYKKLTESTWNISDSDAANWVWERSLDDVNAEIAAKANPELDIMKDSTGFRAYEYIGHLFYDVAGFDAPIFTTEGGYNVGQRAGTTGGDDFRYPKPTPTYVASQTIKAFDEFPLPEWYFANCCWFAAGYQMGVLSAEYEAQAPWFTDWYNDLFNLDGVQPIVQLLKDSTPRLTADGPVPEQWQQFDKPANWQGREMDEKLVLLSPKVQINEASNKEKYWKITHVDYVADGTGYVFFRIKDKFGFVDNYPVKMIDAYGNEYKSPTKGPLDSYWGNMPFNGRPAGSFQLRVDDGQSSDTILNLGNARPDEKPGLCSFYITFTETEGEETMSWLWAEEFDFLALDNMEIGMPPLNQAESYGVTIEEAKVEPGQWYWKIIGIKHLTQEENSGNHNVYVACYDEEEIYVAEDRAVPNAIGWTWEGRGSNESANPVELKAAPERGNIALHMGQVVTTWSILEDLPSDKAVGMHTGHIDQIGHHSFYVVYQKTIKGNNGPVDPPPPVDLPEDCSELEEENTVLRGLVASLQQQVSALEVKLSKAESSIGAIGIIVNDYDNTK